MKKEKHYYETAFEDGEVCYYYTLLDEDGNEEDECFCEVYSLNYKGTFDSDGNEVPFYTD